MLLSLWISWCQANIKLKCVPKCFVCSCVIIVDCIFIVCVEKHEYILLFHQCDDKDFRGPSWRRQFPPRDVHGISMMPGSAETLPAGFRLTATSGHSRRLPPEGKCLSLHLNPHMLTPLFTHWQTVISVRLGFIWHSTWHFPEKWFSKAKQRLNPPVASHLSAGVAAPCCVVTMSLVLSDSVTAALQSSMRRWMTVLTTCIWIGFKVSYAPLRVLGLLALRVLLLYICSLLFTWSLPITVLLYLSFSLWSLTLASFSLSVSSPLESLWYPTPRVLFCRVAK